MANMTRREMLKVGGLSMAGMAATAFLGACGGQQAATEPAATETAAAAETAAATEAAVHELRIDAKTGLLARSEFIGVDEQVELADGSKAVAITSTTVPPRPRS